MAKNSEKQETSHADLQRDPDSLKQDVQNRLKELKEVLDRQEETEARSRRQKEFLQAALKTTAMGKKLNTYTAGKAPHGGDSGIGTTMAENELARLWFCGYIEGDFSERSYIATPITFSGGFVL